MQSYVGIDIGSTCTKTVVLDEKKKILHRFFQPTGWSSVDTAEAIWKKLLGLGLKPEKLRIVATGYGRISVPYAHKCVTEITCHGKGACYLQDQEDLTVVDIGGQDTKIISMAKGLVQDFLMNDKCSAGTGRFVEIMANTLTLRPEELCELAAQGSNTTISSMCTVFAESEVISLIGRGEKRENIAFAVIDSIVKKVAAQAGRLTSRPEVVCLTGGLCGSDYLKNALAQELKTRVISHPEGRYAGAIGAALQAVVEASKD